MFFIIKPLNVYNYLQVVKMLDKWLLSLIYYLINCITVNFGFISVFVQFSNYKKSTVQWCVVSDNKFLDLYKSVRKKGVRHTFETSFISKTMHFWTNKSWFIILSHISHNSWTNCDTKMRLCLVVTTSFTILYFMSREWVIVSKRDLGGW